MNSGKILDNEKKWLIKSDNKILGPFSIEMLEELLFRRQVALIDEIRDMSRRWLYIREVPELKGTVDKVRIELDKKAEETRTIQSVSSAQFASQTVTQTLTVELQQPEATPTPPAFTNVSVSEVTDISFNEIQFPTLEVEKKKSISPFILNSDLNIKNESDKNKKQTFIFGIIFLVIVTACGAGFYFYKKSIQEKNEQALFTKIRKLTIFGADQKAAEAFQKLPESVQNRILPDILNLVLRLDAEGAINLEESLQKLEKQQLSNQQKSQIELIQFNKKLRLNNISLAQGYLVRAKDFDPDSEIVKENEAILNYLENNNKVSSEQFLNLFAANNKGRYLFGVVINHLKQPVLTDNDLVEKIELYLSTHVDFKKELTLAQIYLVTKNSNLAAAKIFTDTFLNTPLKLSQQFKIPGLVFASIYKLDKIIPDFEKIKQLLGPEYSGLIDLHISLEKGDGYTAQKYYDKVQNFLSVSEKNNTQIVIQSILNNYSEVIAIEKTATANQLNTASHLALLRIKKENKNSDFIANAVALKKEKNIISNWAELLKLSDSEPEKIKFFLQRSALDIEDFIPFIEARARLE